MLVDIKLIEPYKGVSAGQYTQVDEEVAKQLVASGLAEFDVIKVETKKGK